MLFLEVVKVYVNFRATVLRQVAAASLPAQGCRLEPRAVRAGAVRVKPSRRPPNSPLSTFILPNRKGSDEIIAGAFSTWQKPPTNGVRTPTYKVRQ